MDELTSKYCEKARKYGRLHKVLYKETKKIAQQEGRWEDVITDKEHAEEVLQKITEIKAVLAQDDWDEAKVSIKVPVVLIERLLNKLESWARIGEFGEKRLREAVSDVHDHLVLRLNNRK